MSFRRYEVILPRRYNDGSAVEPDEFVKTARELAARFGGTSFLVERLRGIWLHLGEEYHDENIRLFVDVEDTPENQRFFRDYKEVLKRRFRQIDLWITSFEISIT